MEYLRVDGSKVQMAQEAYDALLAVSNKIYEKDGEKMLRQAMDTASLPSMSNHSIQVANQLGELIKAHAKVTAFTISQDRQEGRGAA